MHLVDLYFTEQEKSKLRFDLTMSAEVHRAILFRVRQRIYTFLSETEQALAYGHANADIFERNRQYVDERIRFVAPGVLDQFAASYRRMGEEDEEARSQALLSCRRILKSVADSLYPPPEEPVIGLDGKKRQLTSDQFIARLWQFVYERIRGHSSGELLMASVHSVGHRLDQLNNLSSKGGTCRCHRRRGRTMYYFRRTWWSVTFFASRKTPLACRAEETRGPLPRLGVSTGARSL